MRKFTLFYVFIFFVFFSNKSIHAQVVGKPNLGLLTQACASPDFNSFNFTYSFTPASALGSSNQFIAELSDANGSFSNPTVIYTSTAGSVTTFPADVNFEIPTTAAGLNYRIRMRSTDPVSIGSISNALEAYYKPQDVGFTINNLIATGAYCSGGSYLLSIDNPNLFSGDSPLQYSSLTYKWFKQTNGTDFTFVADGETLSVSQSGTYYVETNYGNCSSESVSNRVTVSEVASGSKSSISSSLGNPYCSSNGPTILSTINANGYQWFKDGKEISGETRQMYETNESAEYSVNIDLGNCMTSASIDLSTTGYTSSIDVDRINYIDENETLLTTVTTSAENPEFEWYLNNTLINGANNNSFEANISGVYKVIIRQTTGCLAATNFQFEVKPSVFFDFEKIPSLISPNGDGVNEKWIIPEKYLDGTNTEVVIISSQGSIELSTKRYQNNWPETQLDFNSVNPVYYYIITTTDGQTKKGSITIIK